MLFSGTVYGGAVLQDYCGEDISLHPLFDALQAEVGKDSSIHGIEKTSWASVRQMAEELLLKSKDLWVMSYHCVAVHNESGLTQGVDVLRGVVKMLEEHWEHLYPSAARMQRRLAPLRWLAASFLTIASTTRFVSEKPEVVEALRDTLGKLQDVLDSHHPDNDLRFNRVLDVIDPPSVKGSASQQNSSIGGAAENEAKTTVFPDPSLLSDLEGQIPAGSLAQVLRAVGDSAYQLGIHFLASDLLDERAYQLNRVSCWSSLLHLPTADAQQRTMFSCSVPPEKISLFTSLVDRKQYLQALPHLERAASQAPFWLDGHYLVVRCLYGLEAHAAAAVVKMAFTHLVSRFPGLLLLKFREGVPFASEQTITWIESLLAVPDAQTDTDGMISLASLTISGGDGAELYAEAFAKLGEEGFNAALAHLGSVPPGKSKKFIAHKFNQARLCWDFGEKNAAERILSGLLKQLQEWDLLDWEPELTADIIALLVSAMPAKSKARESILPLLHLYNLESVIVTSD